MSYVFVQRFENCQIYISTFTKKNIDQKVIECCRTHMRSVCGSDMDCLEGPNYKVLFDELQSLS